MIPVAHRPKARGKSPAMWYATRGRPSTGPGAHSGLMARCVACEHRWQAPFDPAAFLFREVEAAVSRLTSEVHQLARAYAWSEESILAMGATRRRRYLDLVAQ